jgi:alkylation response protein AidB-like acyl-CoA dehydrogenase
MNLEFTPDQTALIESVQAIVQDHLAPPTEARRGAFHYSEALENDLLLNGFMDAIRMPEMGALEAVLVIEAVSRSASIVEVGASALVAPSLASEVLPRPIALASGDLSKPQRYLPVAKSMIYDAGESVLVFDVDPENVEPIDSIYAYPIGRFRQVPKLSDGRKLGGPDLVRTLRQWWRVALAAECAGSMASAVDFVVEYTKQRKLFNTTVASFQAVQHRLAHAHRAARGVRFLVLKAAWSGDPFDADQAAGFAQQYISTLVFDLHQFNGAMGVTNENLLHFWTYRLRALQPEVGGANAAALATADAVWGKVD